MKWTARIWCFCMKTWKPNTLFSPLSLFPHRTLDISPHLITGCAFFPGSSPVMCWRSPWRRSQAHGNPHAPPPRSHTYSSPLLLAAQASVGSHHIGEHFHSISTPGISSPLHLLACSLAFCGLVDCIVRHEGTGSGSGAPTLVQPRRLTWVLPFLILLFVILSLFTFSF
jgi:hypothetical protein